MMYCEKCGQEIPEQVICPKCGCLSGYREKKSAKPKSNSPVWSIMFKASCVLGIIVTIFSLMMETESFIHALQDYGINFTWALYLLVLLCALAGWACLILKHPKISIIYPVCFLIYELLSLILTLYYNGISYYILVRILYMLFEVFMILAVLKGKSIKLFMVAGCVWVVAFLVLSGSNFYYYFNPDIKSFLKFCIFNLSSEYIPPLFILAHILRPRSEKEKVQTT